MARNPHARRRSWRPSPKMLPAEPPQREAAPSSPPFVRNASAEHPGLPGSEADWYHMAAVEIPAQLRKQTAAFGVSTEPPNAAVALLGKTNVAIRSSSGVTDTPLPLKTAEPVRPDETAAPAMPQPDATEVPNLGIALSTHSPATGGFVLPSPPLQSPRRSKEVNAGPAARKNAKERTTQGEIVIRNRLQLVKYSKILIAALQEVLEYDPARHHNQPRPDLRIDDADYLQEIRSLVAELRTLNAFLETSRRPPKPTSRAVLQLAAHFDRFLQSYAKSLGKGAGYLTIGVIASLLYQAGIGNDLVAKILSHARLQH
jgi:hypothetical protein